MKNKANQNHYNVWLPMHLTLRQHHETSTVSQVNEKLGDKLLEGVLTNQLASEN